MQTVLFSTARQKLARLLDQVTADKAPVEIVRRDKPSVVVVDKDEYEGMVETLHLLASPRNAERLAAAIAELDAGKGLAFNPTADATEPGS